VPLGLADYDDVTHCLSQIRVVEAHGSCRAGS